MTKVRSDCSKLLWKTTEDQEEEVTRVVAAAKKDECECCSIDGMDGAFTRISDFLLDWLW